MKCLRCCIVIYIILLILCCCSKKEDVNISPVEQDTIIPLGNVVIKDGAIIAPFSVSATRIVYFSQGNLQYQASTDKWRFAENQMDIMGEKNENISSSYEDWIDLFAWGTSGYNSKYPYLKDSDTKYGDNENSIAKTNYDWGVYNAITNGGEEKDVWRTMTIDEFRWLSEGRDNCERLMFMSKIGTKKGLVILPDNWNFDLGIKRSSIYSEEEWNLLESYGAVFFPCAGQRHGTSVEGLNMDGYYWTSSSTTLKTDAYNIKLDSYRGFNIYQYLRYYGFSVRLVKDVQY
ncbi:MAG: hypothetical protein II926_09335 [Bacteroidales bacterium]|nr:hypothetical protein [Bacteroidales bacterium]